MISKTFFPACVPFNLARAIEKKVFLLLMKSSTFLQHLREDEKNLVFGQRNRTKIAMWVMIIATSWFGGEGKEWTVVKSWAETGDSADGGIFLWCWTESLGRTSREVKLKSVLRSRFFEGFAVGEFWSHVTSVLCALRPQQRMLVSNRYPWPRNLRNLRGLRRSQHEINSEIRSLPSFDST